MSNKILISCMYGQRGKRLNPSSNDDAAVVERIIECRSIVPSPDFDLVSMRNTADGTGRDRARKG